MGYPVLRVSADMQISRPVEVVRSHFADIEHHAKNSVHPDVEFVPLGDWNDQRFRKKTRVLWVPVVDEVVLKREEDGSVTESFVAGPNKGMRLVSSFRADGPNLTSVTLSLEMPLKGLRRLALPFLRRLVHLRLTRALEEDRRDLEEGDYRP